MRYSIPTNSPDDWEIIEDPKGEFATLKEAKNELIAICKAHIEDEKLMIKAVREFHL